MNSRKVLRWLVKDAENESNRYYGAPYFPFDKKYDIDDLIFELSNRRNIPFNLEIELRNLSELKDKKKSEANQIIPNLRKTFRNNVTFISLILNNFYPERYFYYRISKLENEIFSGLKFFCDELAEFNLPFSRVGYGKDGFDNYLMLNDALHTFSRRFWPFEDWDTIQKRIHYILYQGFGGLFLEKNSYHRYWIMATNEKNFNSLDKEKETVWSGRKEMQEGDLVFMYRQFPRKAITDLYLATDDSYFDPFGGWDGFWVDLRKVSSINDITMAEMKSDSLLKKWNFVKMQSQGTITDPVPYFIYNRLLEKLDKNLVNEFNLKPEPLERKGQSGQFSSEDEFEDKVIEPILKRWGFKFQRQFPCEFVIGSQSHSCQVDFVVQDGKGLLTLFENKLRITSERDLARACHQAKSYSLQLGISSFVIASPEGIWIYALSKNKEILVEKIDYDMLDINIDKIKKLIYKIRS